MPLQPQLAPFWNCGFTPSPLQMSKLLTASLRVSVATMRRNHFGPSYPWSHSLSQYQCQWLRVGTDQLVNWKLCLPAQLSVYQNSPAKINLPAHTPHCPHSWARPQDTWTYSLQAVTSNRASNPPLTTALDLVLTFVPPALHSPQVTGWWRQQKYIICIKQRRN